MFKGIKQIKPDWLKQVKKNIRLKEDEHKNIWLLIIITFLNMIDD